MSNIQKMNISLLKNQKSSFSNEKSNFMNTTYQTFLSSYLRNCPDSNVSAMGQNLIKLYQKIEQSYQKIDKFWDQYNENVEALENFLSNNVGSGAISESSVRSYITSKMDLLENSKKVKNTKFREQSISENHLITNHTVSSFSSLFADYHKNPSEIKAANMIDQLDKHTKALVSIKGILSDKVKEASLKAYQQATSVLNNWWQKEIQPKLVSTSERLKGILEMTKATVCKTYQNMETIYSQNTLIEADQEQIQYNAQTEFAKNVEVKIEKSFSHMAEIYADMNQANLDANINQATIQAEILKKTGCSVIVGAQSILEGVAHFGESIIDALVSFSTATGDASYFEAYLEGNITQASYQELSNNLWDKTKSFVTKEYVTDWADHIYNNTEYGQTLKNNAFGFDIVRNLGNGVGYTAGIVSLAALTGGSSIAMSGVAGVAGFGSGVEGSWKDGASTTEGLLYGLSTGAWEGIQFYIGSKIGMNGGYGNQIANKIVGQSSSQYKIVKSLVTIILDGIDGGVEGFVQPALQAIYKDGSYQDLFGENGGWGYVATNAVIGSISSAIGEVGDISKYFAGDNKSINPKINIENVIDEKYGFQLNMNDIGDFYKYKLKQGFFSKEQIQISLDNVNKKGYLGENLGKQLKQLFNGENRIYLKTVHSTDVQSINMEGIRCLGTSTSGYNFSSTNISKINLSNTITDVTDVGLVGLVTQLKNANGLSQGLNPIDGAIVLSIPKELTVDQILKYNDSLDLYNIDPKYNKFFIGCDDQGTLKLEMDFSPISRNMSNVDDTVTLSDLDINIKLQESMEILNEFGNQQGIEGYGKIALENYVKTGSVMQIINGISTPYIPSKNGAREFIASLSPTTVSEYLKKITNDNNSYFKQDLIEQKTYELLKNSDFIVSNFSEEQIVNSLKSIHVYASEEDFFKAYGPNYSSYSVLQGFSRADEIHINPKFDSPHIRIHEELHKITSEFDSNGKRIVTGFQNFEAMGIGDYSNGDMIFNEGATEYLTFKICKDDCQSWTYFSSFEFWKGLDQLLNVKYGDNNIIFDSYKNHDATFIKEFVDYYGGKGTFDKIKEMTFLDDKHVQEILDEIRMGVSKELNPSISKKIIGKLRGIFGGNHE